MDTNLNDFVARLYGRRFDHATGTFHSIGSGTTFRIATPHLPPDIELYGSAGHVAIAQAVVDFETRTNTMFLLADNRGREALTVPLYSSHSLFNKLEGHELELDDGTYFDMEQTLSTPDIQLSILHRRLHAGFSLPALTLRDLPLLTKERDVTLVGCTKGHPYTSRGQLKTDFNTKPYLRMTILDQTINTGSSGGVILDNHHNVLGIISSGLTKTLHSEILLYRNEYVTEVQATQSKHLTALVDAASEHILSNDGWLERVVAAYEDR